MNKCKPAPGGYKAGKRAKPANAPEKPDYEEYTVYTGRSPYTGILLLPSHDGPEYGPVTVTDGSGTTIRVISTDELAQRGERVTGIRPTIPGHTRWIDSESIIRKI